MPRRTQIYQKIPWTGGVNTSVDSGVLNPNDLVQADNVVYTISGSRVKREGFEYFDTALPAVTKRSSSGTTRTLVFASRINGGSPRNDLIVVGEKLNITGTSNSNYNNAACIVASITTTDTTDDTITYTFSGAGALNESITASTATSVARNYDIIGLLDFWRYNSSNNAKEQALIGVTSQGFIFSYDSNGRRTHIPISGLGATAFASTPTKVNMLAFNNKVILCFDGYGNTPKVYDPVVGYEWKDLTGSPPDASICQEHLGRVWMNDKANLDRLHYSDTFDETKWKGVDDSGAIDIAQGDGDNVGITAISPPFKGLLLISKNTRLFKLAGDAPENFIAEAMTNGLGVASHQSMVAFDTEDLFYFSRKGAHSAAATDQFGDLSSRFLSYDIQPTFNTWNQQKLSFVQGAYLPNINSVAWIVAEDGQTAPNSIWFYNPTIQKDNGAMGAWYRWPSVNARSIARYSQSDEYRIAIGNNAGRIALGDSEEYTDYSTSGITFRVKSGTIYPDGNPQTIKGFKKFGVIYKPRGRFAFTAYFRVDNFPAQAVNFTQDTDGDLLGSTFILGQSILGATAPLAPFMKDVYGHGRGCTIEIFSTGVDAQVEIYGYIIEYESQDVADEVVS